ncbi:MULTISPECIES: hypothetical protein [unclassified Neorhizobium]|uniref:hypothetical protein n=1 Tax=unclassified Neorhizobium TaxID=2629175 RepID=UPI001FF131C5|nr:MULTISPECIES: hypothetical protein [unclassified Neorhizobium]MCJ9674459.1 hypothetical protein [Neorhizobium sp. SHOUNA12B]MCJ9748979.1 hypothetical protein [Neorhizobium sp. SHOUNA12A]
MPSSLVKAHASAIFVIATLLMIFEWWPGTLVVKLLSGLFVSAFVWRLFIHAKEFGANREVFGKENGGVFLPDLSLRKAVALFRGFSEAGEDRLMFAITCYAIVVGMAGAIANPWWIAISALLFSLTSAHSLRSTWPGFTLVLGSSEDRNFRRHLFQVMSATRPYNTTTMVNFLRAGELEKELDYVLQNRLRNVIVTWESAVEAYASMAKVIVVSIDDLREAVTTELQLLDSKGLWYKTIVFSQGSADEIIASIPLQVPPAAAGALVTSDASQVQDVIKALAQARAPFPTPENPIARPATRKRR